VNGGAPSFWGARLIDIPDWGVIGMTQLTAAFVGTVWLRTAANFLVNLLREGSQQQMLSLRMELFVIANKHFY
jgi:hypothetical protein